MKYLIIIVCFFCISCNNTAPKSSNEKSDSVVQVDTDVTASTIKNDTSQHTDKTTQLSYESSNLNADVSGLNTEFNLSSDYLFDFDKFILKPEADAELKKVATIIQEKGKNIISITGYTDAKGTKAYNDPLSLKRANAVKEWFQKNGLDTFGYRVNGKGADDPVAPNTNRDGSDNPEGRAKNRRVVIVLIKDKSVNR